MNDLANDLAAELQRTLAHEIPITRHLGLAVEAYDGERLTLVAPLAKNLNHKATAFAGSLNAVTTLAGWGLAWLILRELGIAATVVIQHSTSNYLLPVTSDFSARCRKPDAEQLALFAATLRRRGKARIELHVSIEQDGRVAVDFSGRYVVIARQAGEGR